MTTTPFERRIRAILDAHSLTLPTDADLQAKLGRGLDAYAHQCHAASLAFVKAGLVPKGSRVARGSCPGVGGQHSWVVVSTDGNLPDVYDDDAIIVDPTLWSYRDDVDGIWVGNPRDIGHRPHGYGPHIMAAGRPDHPTDEVVKLAPEAYDRLSAMAKHWVDRMFGPLDRRGWIDVANMTVIGWPAGEVIAAMDDTPELSPLVPVDRIGMLTDRNPGGLYLAADR